MRQIFNRAVRQGFRRIAFPAVLVILLTGSAFAAETLVTVTAPNATKQDETNVVTVTKAENNTVAVTVRFTFDEAMKEEADDRAKMVDAFLSWYDEKKTGSKTTISAVISSEDEPVITGGNYIDLTLTFGMADGVTVTGSKIGDNDVKPITITCCALSEKGNENSNITQCTTNVTLQVIEFNDSGVKISLNNAEKENIAVFQTASE